MTESFAQTLAAFTERAGLDPFVFDERGCCLVPLDEGVLHLSLRDDPETLILSCTLGTVAPEARGEVFAQLLAANLYWGETAGGTLAWQAELEEVLFQYAQPTAALDAERLAQLFQDYLAVAQQWRLRLAELAGEAAEQAAKDRAAAEELADEPDHAPGEEGMVIIR